MLENGAAQQLDAGDRLVVRHHRDERLDERSGRQRGDEGVHPRPTTTNPLSTPMSSATPRAIPTAGATPTPVWAAKWATVTPLSVIVKATDRSNTRAASGITTLSAMSPVTALLLRICSNVVPRRERARHPDREREDDEQPHVDGADVAEGERAPPLRRAARRARARHDVSLGCRGVGRGRVGAHVSLPSIAWSRFGSVIWSPVNSVATTPWRRTSTRVHMPMQVALVRRGDDHADAGAGLLGDEVVELHPRADVDPGGRLA